MSPILVTGASRGIGFETARVLASRGYSVIATARNEERLAHLKSLHPDVQTVPADLSTVAGVNSILNVLQKDKLRLGAVVHQTGALINKPFQYLTDMDWEVMLQTNLMSAVRLIRAVLSRLDNPSHIVLIGSMGGYQGSSKYPGLAAYSVSKGALSILAECLAGEFSASGVKVNCLCLGAVQTEMLAEAFPGYDAPVTAGQMGTYVSDFALNGHQVYNGKVLPVALSNP